MILGEDDRRGQTESSITDNGVTFKSGLRADLKQTARRKNKRRFHIMLL